MEKNYSLISKMLVNVKRGKNYSKFYAEDDKRYGVVSRIDNTLVLTDTTKNYKKEVKKLIEEIGY